MKSRPNQGTGKHLYLRSAGNAQGCHLMLERVNSASHSQFRSLSAECDKEAWLVLKTKHYN
jgi:hypothetical protein